MSSQLESGMNECNRMNTIISRVQSSKRSGSRKRSIFRKISVFKSEIALFALAP